MKYDVTVVLDVEGDDDPERVLEFVLYMLDDRNPIPPDGRNPHLRGEVKVTAAAADRAQ